MGWTDLETWRLGWAVNHLGGMKLDSDVVDQEQLDYVDVGDCPVTKCDKYNCFTFPL